MLSKELFNYIIAQNHFYLKTRTKLYLSKSSLINIKTDFQSILSSIRKYLQYANALSTEVEELRIFFSGIVKRCHSLRQKGPLSRFNGWNRWSPGKEPTLQFFVSLFILYISYLKLGFKEYFEGLSSLSLFP